MSERITVRFLRDDPESKRKAGELYKCRTIQVEKYVKAGLVEVVGQERAVTAPKRETAEVPHVAEPVRQVAEKPQVEKPKAAKPTFGKKK